MCVREEEMKISIFVSCIVFLSLFCNSLEGRPHHKIAMKVCKMGNERKDKKMNFKSKYLQQWQEDESNLISFNTKNRSANHFQQLLSLKIVVIFVLIITLYNLQNDPKIANIIIKPSRRI